MFHAPRREEIIVSASRIVGTVPAAERTLVIERVFADALEAARRAATHPDLKVTMQLTEEVGFCAFRCDTILAGTAARDTFFDQAVIQHPQGVVFLTYEVPL